MIHSRPETWQITPQDQMKYDQHFNSLHPINGCLNGKNAKDFFLQSGLPNNVLAQIWTLADIDKDGQLNRLEFSIAMFLIKKCLEGNILPSQLPPSLFSGMPMAPLMGMTPSTPVALNNGMTPMLPMRQSLAMSAGPVMGAIPPGGMFPMVAPYTASPVIPPQAVDYNLWTLKNQVKPRYRLEFNQQDHHRRGYLTGPEASRLLSQSELPQVILAQIWFLSDIDADGNMTFEEYCLAQFLIEQAKKGIPLPSTLPENLRQSALACGAPSANHTATSFPTSTTSFPTPSPQLTILNDSSAASSKSGESMNIKSREDERRENFLKGQEELAKRQALLKEQVEKEEEARRESERQEKERLEKIRLEKERLRQLELEKQVERQRQMERERAEEARRLMEEHERQRRETERVRLLQVEARRLESGLQEKRREQELLENTKIRQCEKGEDLSRSQLRLHDLQMELEEHKMAITQLRDTIGSSMRQERDRLDQIVRDLNLQVEAARAEKERIQKEIQRLRIEEQRSSGPNAPSSEQVKALINSIQAKRTKVEEFRANCTAMEKELEAGGETLATRRNKAADVERRCRRSKAELVQVQQQLQTSLQRYSAAKRQRQQQAAAKSATAAAAAANNTTSTKSWTKTDSNKPEDEAKRKYSDFNAHFMKVFAPQATSKIDAVSRDPFADHDVSLWNESTASVVGEGLKRYEAQFDFESRQSDELSFKKGDIIIMDPQQQGDGQGWLYGHIEGTERRGLFPETYCVLITDAGAPSADALLSIDPFQPATGMGSASTSAFQPPNSVAKSSSNHQVAAASNFENELYEVLPEPSTQPPPKSSAMPQDTSQSSGWLVEALYDWSAQSVSHMSDSGQQLHDLRGGERYRVVREEGEWSCTEDGSWFPTNYVRRVDDSNSSGGVQVSGSASSQNPLLADTTSSSVATTQLDISTEATATCLTLYPYESQELGDLRFQANQLIHILSTDGEWWRGYVDGEPQKTGLFPANYVRKLEPQEAEAMLRKSAFAAVKSAIAGQLGSPAPGPKAPAQIATSTPVNHNVVPNLSPKKPAAASSDRVRLPNSKPQGRDSPSAAVAASSGPSSRRQSHQSNAASTATPPVSANAAASAVPLVGGPEVAEVLIPYTATGSEQLSLEVGQLIQIRKRSDTGWWEGEIQQRGQKRRVGWFPRDYVKVLTANEGTSAIVGALTGSSSAGGSVTPQPDSHRNQPSPSNDLTAQSRSKSSLGLDSAHTAPAADTRAGKKTPISSQNSVESPSRKSKGAEVVAPTPVASPPTEEKVVTLFAFKAIHLDELSFEKGVNIVVLSKDEPEWWRGRLEDSGVEGLFPVNYVKPLSGGGGGGESTPRTGVASPSQEKHRSHHHGKDKEHKKRQLAIQEVQDTERSYYESLLEVHEKFYEPMRESGLVSQEELDNIFINWMELMVKSHNFYMALHIRLENASTTEGVTCIGDVLVENFSHLDMYVRFASCQNSSMALLTHLESTKPALHELLQRCQSQTASQKLPLGSYFLKPVQRITRYKLLVENILKHTESSHIDHGNLEEAHNTISQLLDSVNESIRERENSHCLEWLQSRVNCEGLNEKLCFNSNTNAVGPRKLLKSGTLYKVKSGKELIAFLFNDFLLFTTPLYNTGGLAFVFPSNLSQAGYLPSSTSSSSISGGQNGSSAAAADGGGTTGGDSQTTNFQFRLYKHPILLNELEKLQKSDGVGVTTEQGSATIAMPQTGSDVNFAIKLAASPLTNNSSPETIVLRARTNRDRDAWVEKIREAHQKYQELENAKKQKSMSIRRATGVGRLLLTIVEGVNLKPGTGGGDGKADPYCEVTLGNQSFKTNVVHSSLNPKWNCNMNFMIRSLHQEVLSIAVYDKDYFQPNDFLGRAELPVSEIMAAKKVNPGHLERELTLKGVKQGAIRIKMDLIMFERSGES